jgi:hypothetical protein
MEMVLLYFVLTWGAMQMVFVVNALTGQHGELLLPMLVLSCC